MTMMDPLKALSLRFGDKSHQTNSGHSRFRDAREVVLSHDVKLIFVDEAEQLNTQGLEFLRTLVDATDCAILFIGSAGTMPASPNDVS
jgi:DNA transposition AAA+ family ATPase